MALFGFAVGLLSSVVGLHAAQPPSTSPLLAGAHFPTFSGRTITNHPLTLPESRLKTPMVLVFTFSRRAGSDAGRWNQHLAKDFTEDVSTYGVIELESAPKLFRPLAISGIKSSMPVPVQDRTVVLDRDDQLWRERLGVNDKNRAYLVLLDRSGVIDWMSPAAFSEATYGTLRARLAALFRSHP